MKHFRCIVSAGLVGFLIACSQPVSFQDGSYTVFGSGFDANGWTPVLFAEVSAGEISVATFDLLNRHGDYLALQNVPRTTRSQETGGDPGPPLSALAQSFQSAPRTRVEPAEGNSWIVDEFNALASALVERAESGETGNHRVNIEHSGNVASADALGPWLSPEYRNSRTAAARGQSATPGDRAGGMAVVASHRSAVEAGMGILRAGGTAADAAVTVAATMSVVEPYFSSALGGGTWLLYYDAETGTVTSIDGVGPAPEAAANELFQDDDFFGRNGIHRSNVPGSWGGYIELLKAYGSKGLDEILAPAIRYAEQGTVIGPGYTRWLGLFSPLILSWPYSAAVYAPDGEVVAKGDTLFNPDIARTYRELVSAWSLHRGGGERAALDAAAEYFYRGPIAEKIVAFSDENGGLFTRADFADFTEYGLVEPLSIEYRGLTVYQNPPNSQGIAQLQALKILEGFDFSSRTPDDPEVIHLMSEAIKLAFVDRNRYVADPNFVDVPVAELLSDEYAAAQRARISLDEALEWPIEDRLGMAGDERSTTTFHVIDRYGNAAAVTTSIGVSFLIAGETGIHMNERLTFMHKDTDDINRVDGGKKVRHSSGPHMVLRDGVPWIIGGNTGADFQPQGQLQQFLWIVEFGLGAQEAIDRPRFEPQAFAATFRPWAIQNRLQLEPGRFSEEVQADLAARGHTIEAGGTVGAANLILVDDHSSGRIEAGWESREADSYGMVEMPE